MASDVPNAAIIESGATVDSKLAAETVVTFTALVCAGRRFAGGRAGDTLGREDLFAADLPRRAPRFAASATGAADCQHKVSISSQTML
jgi:hypothetical protein